MADAPNPRLAGRVARLEAAWHERKRKLAMAEEAGDAAAIARYGEGIAAVERSLGYIAEFGTENPGHRPAGVVINVPLARFGMAIPENVANEEQ